MGQVGFDCGKHFVEVGVEGGEPGGGAPAENVEAELFHRSMSRLGGVEVDADAGVAGEAEGGHIGPDEDVSLVDEGRVEEGGEGGAIEDGDYAGINAEEEGEGRGHIGAEDGAVVSCHAAAEEFVLALEPEVVEPVLEGPEERNTVAAGDGPDREGVAAAGGGGRWRRRGRYNRGADGMHFLWFPLSFRLVILKWQWNVILSSFAWIILVQVSGCDLWGAYADCSTWPRLSHGCSDIDGYCSLVIGEISSWGPPKIKFFKNLTLWYYSRLKYERVCFIYIYNNFLL